MEGIERFKDESDKRNKEDNIAHARKIMNDLALDRAEAFSSEWEYNHLIGYLSGGSLADHPDLARRAVRELSRVHAMRLQKQLRKAEQSIETSTALAISWLNEAQARLKRVQARGEIDSRDVDTISVRIADLRAKVVKDEV